MNRGPVLGLSVTILATVVPAIARQAPIPTGELHGIEHHPSPCMDTETFPLIEARAATTDAPRRMGRLALRFKAENDTGWYETDFQRGAGLLLQAVLPRPRSEAARVRYYIAGTHEPEQRSPEYQVEVLMGGCPGARSAPEALTERIRVRRTSESQDEIPAGFYADGITAAGRWSRTSLGAVAAAGAGAGVAALVIAGDEASIIVEGNDPQAVRACFTPDPIPDIDSGGTILFDASCTTPETVTSYRWSFGDGTTGEGSSVEHFFTPGGIYTVTLTASDGPRTDNTSRVVRVRATPSACFITTPDPPRILANESINFNAECSLGDRDGGPSAITRYEWDFGDGRPGAEGVFVSRRFAEPDVYGVRLTVTNEDGRQATNTQFVVVEREATGNSRSTPFEPEVSFTSHLELEGEPQPPGVQLTVNDSLVDSSSTTSPRRHRLRARVGENLVEGRLLRVPRTEGRWRFDFRDSARFEPGSLSVDSGEILTLDSHGLVFRLSREPGLVLRFRFRLRE